MTTMKRYLLTLLSVLAISTVYAQEPEFSIARFKDDKSCAVSFTFDDGLADHITLAAPELEKRGWTGTFWICGAKVSGEIKDNKDFMTWGEIEELHRRGHEISNHGWNHKKLPKLSVDRMIEEVQKNDSAIFVHTRRYPTTFCYPYNSKSDEVLAITEKGRSGTRTRQFALGSAVSLEKTKKRLDDAIRKKEWAVWMTHGILHGYDSFAVIEDFTHFLDYVKQNEKDVWVGTFHEVAAYVKERDSVSLQTIKKGRNWVVIPSLELDPEVFDQRLTLIVETDCRKIVIRQNGNRLPVRIYDGRIMTDIDPFGGDVNIKIR